MFEMTHVRYIEIEAPIEKFFEVFEQTFLRSVQVIFRPVLFGNVSEYNMIFLCVSRAVLVEALTRAFTSICV